MIIANHFPMPAAKVTPIGGRASGGPPAQTSVQAAPVSTIYPRHIRSVVWRALLAVAVVSGGMNLLLLVPALYMLQVYDRVLSTQHVETLLALTGIAVFALVILALLDAARGAVGVRLGAWVERTLSAPLLHATVHGAPLLGTMRGAQALRELGTVRSVFGGPLWPLLDAPWTPVFFALAFLVHPLLGWIGITGGVVLLLLAIANELLTRRAVQQSGAAAITALNDADAAVRNADSLIAMGMLPSWLAAWSDKREEASAPHGTAAMRSNAIGAVAKSARQVLQIAILGFGAWLVIRHELTAGAMIATSIIIARAMAPFEQAIVAWRGMVGAQASWRSLSALLLAAPPALPGVRLPRPSGSLLADNVVYAAPGQREPILKQVSFAAKGGEMLLVIGPSGAGKSTLARIVVGSLAPHSGAVRLDSGAIAHWSPLDRAMYVGYLPQDVELFNGTVRDNIARFTRSDDCRGERGPNGRRAR